MFRLYVIADRAAFPSDRAWLAMIARLAPAVAARPDVAIQVRAKDAAPEARPALAAAARDAVAAATARAFWNGSAREAREAGFAGVHWPEVAIPECAPPEAAGLVVGASVHSAATATRAAAAGARFVVFGPVFDPGSKPGRGVGLAALRAITAATDLPVLAVGGVTPERTAACRDAGAAGVAAIGAVVHAADPVAAIDAFFAGELA
jgi:thiamine-phosphate pyrophosphorylase